MLHLFFKLFYIHLKLFELISINSKRILKVISNIDNEIWKNLISNVLVIITDDIDEAENHNPVLVMFGGDFFKFLQKT